MLKIPLGKDFYFQIGDLLKKSPMHSNEISNYRARKRRPFYTGDCLIEVATWTGLSVNIHIKYLMTYL
jgi:hypothetical protein